jgi:hypothetical protein
MQMEQKPSELDNALVTIYSLIEQANGNGFFKKLSDLDHVRKAFSVVTTEFETLEKKLKNASEQNLLKKSD